MIRWVAAIFIALTVFSALLPGLLRLGVGRVPGDVRFNLRGVPMCLPFGSTLVLSALAFLIAELLQ